MPKRKERTNSKRKLKHQRKFGVVATAVTSKSDPVDDQEKWIIGAGKINQQKTTNIIVNQNDHFYCHFTV